MKPISFQQVRQVVSGKLLAPAPVSLDISDVCTDSRQIKPGCLFVALRGESHDGHEFLPQAAAGGAVAALVEREPAQKQPNVALIQVGCTRTALGKLARFVRQQMTRCRVVAVAGSNGKTGTKRLIDIALCSRLSGSCSPRSFNNEIGVPLTIFPADPMQDYLVLEMGTNHPGEIGVLTRMAQPDIAVITNCSAEHLEGLGDLMGVRRENASIIEGLKPNGALVVNGDDPQLLDAVANYPGKKITFGFKPHNDLFATEIECDLDGVRFLLNGRRQVFVPLLGRHIASNALAAIAVGRRFGLEEEQIIQNLAHAEQVEMRLQLQEVRGMTVLNDCYNANPASMKAALDTLFALPADGRRIAILGDMRELGASSQRLHREIGHFAATGQLDLLLCVGSLGRLIGEAAEHAGLEEERISYFDSAAAASTAAVQWLLPGDLVLLKGSRAMRLEAVAQALGAGRGLIRAAS